MDDIIVVRGAGDIASGIAYRLYKCGYRLIMTEIERPLVVRRSVAFANAIPEGKMEIEGVCAVKADEIEAVYRIWNDNNIPVLCDSKCRILDEIKPLAVIDAILAKRNTGTHMDMAKITIGVGPGFEAGADVDAVVETKRGHDLGKVIYKGFAEPDTGIPGSIMGYSQERLLRAPVSGTVKTVHEIGELVKRGEIVAFVGSEPVQAQLDGALRGLIAEGTEVPRGLKIGDVDPRGIKEYCFTISDKSRAVAGGVLEAILVLSRTKCGR